jgi:hypothetical protein
MGNAVSISGDLAIVGSSMSDNSATNSGSAYLFITGGSGQTGGPGTDGVSEGLLAQVSGGPESSGHVGSDTGSFVCDGSLRSCVILPCLKGIKSIALWVKITAQDAGERYLLDARDNDSGQGLPHGYIQTKNFGSDWGTFYVDGDNITSTQNRWDAIPKNQWTHVYVETSSNFDGNLNIMSNYLQGETLKGSLDEVRVYNRSLTSDEIKSLSQL